MTNGMCVVSDESDGVDDCDYPGTLDPKCADDTYFHNICDGQQCTSIENSTPGVVEEDECSVNTDCEEQNKPVADQLNISSPGDCTGITGAGILHFSWRYTDANEDKEIRYILQIDDNSDFLSPKVNRIFPINNYPSPSINSAAIYVVPLNGTINGDYIYYNTNYYWRVMVVDDSNAENDNDISEWAYGTSFTHDGYPAPSPKFSFEPTSPELGQEVIFDDQSSCYDNDGYYECSNLVRAPGNTYEWQFGDGSAPDTKVGDGVTHIYTSTSTGVSLKVCDQFEGSPRCCIYSKPMPLKTPGGKAGGIWKEISPF
jgi:hypothetical protein